MACLQVTCFSTDRISLNPELAQGPPNPSLPASPASCCHLTFLNTQAPWAMCRVLSQHGHQRLWGSSSRCHQETQHPSKATSSEKPSSLSLEAAGSPSCWAPFGHTHLKQLYLQLLPCLSALAPELQAGTALKASRQHWLVKCLAWIKDSKIYLLNSLLLTTTF